MNSMNTSESSVSLLSSPSVLSYTNNNNQRQRKKDPRQHQMHQQRQQDKLMTTIKIHDGGTMMMLRRPKIQRLRAPLANINSNTTTTTIELQIPRLRNTAARKIAVKTQKTKKKTTRNSNKKKRKSSSSNDLADDDDDDNDDNDCDDNLEDESVRSCNRSKRSCLNTRSSSSSNSSSVNNTIIIDYISHHDKNVQKACAKIESNTTTFTGGRSSKYKKKNPPQVASLLLDHGNELSINEEMSLDGDQLRTKSHNSITELNVFGSQQSAVGVVDNTGSIPIVKKLGSGQFGSVFLMRCSSSTSPSVAIKIQNPTGCLAWEYQIMKRLHQRLSLEEDDDDDEQVVEGANNNNDQQPKNKRRRTRRCTLRNNNMLLSSYYHNSSFSSFPYPISIVTFRNGGILSMSAGSESGLNLVDVTNFYQFHMKDNPSPNRRVPELLVLHYASIIIDIIRKLHQHCHILHCDVKPDNFILCPFQDPQHGFYPFRCANLMLIDFGKSIDLQQTQEQQLVSTERDRTKTMMFRGSTAIDTMRCMSMRNNQPWSYDADTFGVCCCVHLLLFGTHLELDTPNSLRESNRRNWNRGSSELQPTTTLKSRSFQELWRRIFNELLSSSSNSDNDTGIPSSSHATNLKQLKEMIDSTIRQGENHVTITNQLRRLSNNLPDCKEAILSSV